MQIKITINERGVFTLPAAIRQALGIKANDEFIVENTAQGIVLRPSISVPLEFYSDERIAEFTADEAAIGKLLRRKR